jgi:hypothetical protein
MRRRRSEEPGCPEAADPRPDPLAELSARELLAAVEEEVRRLPEAYRLPVLLCCLEGRTREEAAALLGWSEGSVKGRLERGRARLHARLARRGLTLSAALAAAELSHGTVPAACVGPTVRGALLFAAGTGVASGAGELAKGVVRAMVLTRIKAVAALLLAVAVLGLGARGVEKADSFGAATVRERSARDRSQTVAAPKEAAPKDAFAISYGHAGLTSLTVEKGKLHYSWVTSRKPRSGKPGPELQSMESYDLHKATIWLTEAEEKKFREWVARHKLFDFKGEYRSASGGRSYGAAFQSGLTVTAGGRKHGIAWVGDSKTPETLNAAVGELLSLAAAVEKDRRQ